MFDNLRTALQQKGILERKGGQKMKTQLDEKQDLLSKIERLSSADEVQKVKAFIAGMEAGKAVREMERGRAS